jgi:hypothetical protein
VAVELVSELGRVDKDTPKESTEFSNGDILEDTALKKNDDGGEDERNDTNGFA